MKFRKIHTKAPVSDSLYKVADLSLQIYLKRVSDTGVFL